RLHQFRPALERDRVVALRSEQHREVLRERRIVIDDGNACGIHVGPPPGMKRTSTTPDGSARLTAASCASRICDAAINARPAPPASNTIPRVGARSVAASG